MAEYAQTRQHHETRFFQYPSPTSENFTDSAIGSEIMNDPKSRLQIRLDDLQRRIIRSSLADGTLTAIHESLDHIGDLLSSDDAETESEEPDMEVGLGISGVEIVDPDYSPEASTPTGLDAPEGICRAQSQDATLAQSQALLVRVTHAVEQLRLREEEFRVSNNLNHSVDNATPNKQYSISTTLRLSRQKQERNGSCD